MRGNLRLEIPEAVPAEALVEIHLGEGHCAPFLCLRQRASVVTVHGGSSAKKERTASIWPAQMIIALQ